MRYLFIIFLSLVLYAWAFTGLYNGKILANLYFVTKEKNPIGFYTTVFVAIFLATWGLGTVIFLIAHGL